jgi:hypothetical protein
VQYDNVAGINLWTYDAQVSWDYQAYTVTRVSGLAAWSQSSCCLWNFQGNSTVNPGGAGGANFTAIVQGRYQICVVWACTSKSPYMTFSGNGNGVEAGFSWGIG